MTMLVILLPPHARVGHEAPEPGALAHVLSSDGMAVASSGRAEPAQLPSADSVVAVLPAGDVAWHRVAVPRAPAARMRLALSGVLEEQLLDEPDDVHLALAPDAKPGQDGWVGATQRPPLAAALARLTASGIVVDRVVPACAPSELAQGHFFTGNDADQADTDDLWLAWSDVEGAICLRTSGGLARSLLPTWSARSPRWTATPAAAAAAERWLGSPVVVQSDVEHALAAARSGWNLRQFDLALQTRGLRAVRSAARQVLGPSWRPVRWGLAALLGVQLIGVNAWAWQQQRAIDAKRNAVNELLRTAHPQVRAVLDAPVQMQRETDLLRAAAGQVGDTDLETLLALAAAAWPEGRPPVEQLKFEPGRLTLPATGWAPEQVQQLRTRIVAAGGQLDSTESELIISRGGRKATP